MKRYLVFTYQSYYPSGGFKDFDSAYDTLEAAQKARQQKHSIYGGSHIVDLTTLRIVESQYENYPTEQNLP